MEDLRRRTGRSGLELILVNVWEGAIGRNEAKRFAELWGVDGPVLVDETGEFAARLGVRGVPANVFVDSSGTVTAVTTCTPGDLEAATRGLLGPGAAIESAGRPQMGGHDHEHIQRNIHQWDGGGTGGQDGAP